MHLPCSQQSFSLQQLAPPWQTNALLLVEVEEEEEATSAVQQVASLFVVEAASEEQQAWLGQHCLVSVQQVAWVQQFAIGSQHPAEGSLAA